MIIKTCVVEGIGEDDKSDWLLLRLSEPLPVTHEDKVIDTVVIVETDGTIRVFGCLNSGYEEAIEPPFLTITECLDVDEVMAKLGYMVQ